MTDSPFKEPLVLRGHILLCFQGFRGLGYSADFVENMKKIHEIVAQSPQTLVKPIVGPDLICKACPHLNLEEHGGCTLHGPGTEKPMSLQDKEVLKRLGLIANQVVSWETILARIGQRIKPSHLSEICGNCPWLNLGHCQEGIDRLKE